MNVVVHPAKVSGQIKVPTSKSMAHRAIICASLAQGVSHIDDVSFSEDILATIDCMRSLGAKIKQSDNHLIIEGIDQFEDINESLNCRESGSTLRFLIPICTLAKQEITLKGATSLLSRPQSVYEDIFRQQGLMFNKQTDCITVSGRLKPLVYQVNGNISSQFISGLLFTLPLLEADSEIHIVGEFQSQSYVDLTLEILSHFGIIIKKIPQGYYVFGNQEYQANQYTVETDYSQLAFFAVLATINHPLDLVVNNKHSLQGDRIILNYVKQYGATIIERDWGYRIKPGKVNTELTYDLANCPDLGPILTVLGSQALKLTLTQAQRLRYKECDRIEAMQTELTKLGVNISSDDNTIYINGWQPILKKQRVSGWNDHRIVMSLAVFATICPKPIIIEGAEAISKSYPAFFQDLQAVGVQIDTL